MNPPGDKKNVYSALSSMTTGIYILTTSYEDIINGMIVSWATQISYEPPLVLVAVHPKRYTHGLILKSRSFALNILSTGQKYLVSRFKDPEISNRFSGIKWRKGKTGSPILNECIAFLDCRLVNTYEPGNHTLFIGEIIDGDINSTEKPLSNIEYGKSYLGNT